MNDLLKEEQELFKYESAIYEKMRKIAGKLNTRIIEPIVRIKLVDGKSGAVKLARQHHSHSFVRNMYVNVTIAPTLQVEGTLYADGHLRTWRLEDSLGQSIIQDLTPESLGGGFYAAVDDDHHGILVGRDATAESFDDFELGNLVTDGSGPNQLEYIQMTKSESWVGGSSYYESTWTRALDNGSGSPVTIYETGLFYDDTGISHLITRDIDAGGVAVPDGDRLYVEYEIRTSFP